MPDGSMDTLGGTDGRDETRKNEKRNLPLFGELRKNGSLAVESHQDQAASEAFLLNSPKSGKIRFSIFLVSSRLGHGSMY